MTQLESYADVPRFISAHRAKDLAIRLQPGATVAIAGRVIGVKEVPGDRYGHRVIFQDFSCTNQLQTLPVCGDPDLLDRAFDAVQKGQVVIAVGTFPAYEKGDPRYDGPQGRMELLDLRPVTRPTTLLAPARDELLPIDLLVDRMLYERGFARSYLLEQARRLCGVESAYLSDRYLLAEEGVLAQALSHAQVPQGVNSRLSIFSFSGPGTGKTLLGDYARVLAPVDQKVQPASVTAVGLSASVKLSDGEWRSKPGVLPRASGGVCVLDDLHRLDRRHLTQVQGVLMPVLESGVIRNSKAGAGTYEARCAVLMTSNRVSLRNGKMVMAAEGGPQGRASDLVLPFDLFSRVDLVFNLGEGDDAVRGR